LARTRRIRSGVHGQGWPLAGSTGSGYRCEAAASRPATCRTGRYALTRRGRSLHALLTILAEWADKDANQAYDDAPADT